MTEYPHWRSTGLLTLFGSLNVAVPFLLDLFRIPADTFQLFLATGVINARFGSLVAAVHTVTVALLGTVRDRRHSPLASAPAAALRGVTAVLAAAIVGGTRALHGTCSSPDPTKATVLADGDATAAAEPGAATVVHDVSPAPATRRRAVLERDPRARRAARRLLPRQRCRSRCQRRGELVGFDVELAHDLARDLGVTLEFVPVDRERSADAARRRRVRPRDVGRRRDHRAGAQVRFSESYLDETVAFVVPDHQRDAFADWNAIRRWVR